MDEVGAGQTLGNAFLRFCASHLYWLGESPYAEKKWVHPAFSLATTFAEESSSSSGFVAAAAGRATLSDTGWIVGDGGGRGCSLMACRGIVATHFVYGS